MESKKSIFIVITGPSGAGKTTITQSLLECIPDSIRLVTTTTRTIRQGEVDGIDYNFIPTEEFLRMKSHGEFFEHAQVYDQYYGSQETKLKELLKNHSVVFSLVDVEGARTIKTKIPNAVTIFIAPDAINELNSRLLERNDTNMEDIKKRIKKATYEMDVAQEFDVIIKNVNGKLEETINKTLAYINKHLNT